MFTSRPGSDQLFADGLDGVPRRSQLRNRQTFRHVQETGAEIKN
ncbi:MAG TPA: hypothetical protein VF444_01795 [Pseudonocardiaceae bacterium]